MESEKVKEIKKALKCCCNGCDCDCPFYSNGSAYEKCRNFLFETLTLINELKSENETIKLNMQETEKSSFNINQMNGNLVLENQQLKDRITELKKENANKTNTITDLLKKQEFYETEKLKQFANRLKEKLFDLGNIVNENDIDETLKEFVKE